MAPFLNFSTEARTEFDDAFNWYVERSVGAAIGFVTEIDVAIELILADPRRFARTFAGCQLCRLKRYPYCVVYHNSADTITVVAVAHTKRRPGYWHTRL